MDTRDPCDERDGMEIHLPRESSDPVREECARVGESAAGEAARKGLRELREDERWRAELREAIEVGVAQCEAGDVVDPAAVYAELKARIEEHRRKGL